MVPAPTICVTEILSIKPADARTKFNIILIILVMSGPCNSLNSRAGQDKVLQSKFENWSFKHKQQHTSLLKIFCRPMCTCLCG